MLLPAMIAAGDAAVAVCHTAHQPISIRFRIGCHCRVVIVAVDALFSLLFRSHLFVRLDLFVPLFTVFTFRKFRAPIVITESECANATL